MTLAPPVSALIPFVPRVVEIRYFSQPSGPIIYVSSGSTAMVSCPATYPFDPRNLSLVTETT